MHLSISRLLSLSTLAATAVSAAGWSFQDGSVTVTAKGAGVGGGSKESLSPDSLLPTELSLGTSDSLKIVLTTVDGKTAKRPHQAFFTLFEPGTGLEESWPLNVKENGKAKLDLSQKDLPHQFLTSDSALTAKLTIASFGSSKPYTGRIFPLRISRDSSTPLSIPAPPLRYGKQPEIHHIFRGDPKSPPFVVSGFFTLAVIATLPVLLGAWLALGANFNHLGKALNGAPVSHALFLGSIVGIEGVFFLYYTTWNLFQMLPAVGVLGAVAIVSGSRALSEVQERRLAGER
ncbi:Oligosaccharyltransferase subunit Ribophorin II-domain-containing protein [Elsinoe ampelina]|uniref:Oligosaccharyltransferase subunit Ribophorin II-domain-containing protein n=1 Tax=Elsinoe ampelina TaxID=302913 RepID=A0A6A6GDF6_9PEZI|nr:Oligosaccharyltransferase subunit Ribophorin II-domain-containing protein [Elsinoe ampelina]